MAYITDTDNIDQAMNGDQYPGIPAPLKKVINLRKNKSFTDMDLDKTQDWGGMGGNDGTNNGGAKPNSSTSPSKPVIQSSEGADEAPKVAGVNAPMPSATVSAPTMGDTVSQGVSDQLNEAVKNAPQLKKQGSGNPLIRLFQKGTGMVGDTPKPGELYNTPEEQAKNRSGFGQILHGIGDVGLGLAAGGGGMPQQHQASEILAEEPKLALQRANVQNEMEHRRALENEAQQRIGNQDRGVTNQENRTGILQQGQDTKDSTLNLKGTMTGYKKQMDGSWRPMTADEYAQDPRLKNVPELANAALQLKQQETELTRLRQGNYDVNSPIFQQHERDIQSRLALTREGINAGLERAEILAGPRQQGTNLAYGKEAEQIWKLPMDSSSQLLNMRQSYQEVLKGNQQAALNLLSNHVGMTMGGQPGARITQAIYDEAQASDPILRRVQARFDENGYLTGVVITPEQAAQMVQLGEQKYRLNVQKARNQAEYLSTLTGQKIGEPPLAVDPDSPIGGGGQGAQGNAQPLPNATRQGNGPRQQANPTPTSLNNAVNSKKPVPKW